jgi:hypothetical protein
LRSAQFAGRGCDPSPRPLARPNNCASHLEILQTLFRRGLRKPFELRGDLSQDLPARRPGDQRAFIRVLSFVREAARRLPARGFVAVAAIIALSLFAIAIVHFCWGIASMEEEAVLASEYEDQSLAAPTNTECLDVAAALILASVIVAARGELLRSPMPEAWTHIGAFAVGTVLIARGIGDFRYVGFFKRVRDTAFAEWDTRLFSPISFLLGVATLWLAVH